MKIKVEVVIESDDGDTKTVESITCLERGRLRPEDLGLRRGTDSCNITQ
jgi:hypothetical protein